MRLYLQTGVFAGFISLLMACQSQPKKTLTGEWRWLEPRENSLPDSAEINAPPANSSVSHEFPGLHFLSADSLENPMGFSDYDAKADAYDTGKPVISYVGSRTAYKYSGESLSIFDRSIKKWKSYIVVRNGADTLVLKDKEGLLAWYVNTAAQPQYDAISIASSGCFGSCPITKILLFSDGRVFSHAEEYTKYKGLLEARIDTAIYQDIVHRFNKMPVIHLKARYLADHTDDNTITVTFMKNGRMVKTVSDYGHESPAQFIWAYTYVLNLSSLINYQPYNTTLSPVLFSCLEEGSEKTVRTLLLHPSESFLLWYYLSKGKIINPVKTRLPYSLKFKSNYSVDFSSGHVKKEKQIAKLFNRKQFELQKIFTDGRFVKFASPEKQIMWIDLGFNFIERSDILSERFFSMKSTDTERELILQTY